MFDPKITPGPWQVASSLPTYAIRAGDRDIVGTKNRFLPGNSHENCGVEYLEDAKAIAAVPELLAMYKAAKRFSEDIWRLYGGTTGEQSEYDLDEAIQALEERHGK